MGRVVLVDAFANEAFAMGGQIRAAVMLFAVVVAAVAFAIMSLLARVFREAVAMSVRLFAAAATAAGIGLLAVVLIATLLFGSGPGA